MRGDYALFDVEEDGLLGLTERLRAGELDGLNVTIPHKEASCQVVDRLMGPAASIGALNTLVRAEDGALEGHNTDVAGVVGVNHLVVTTSR